MAAFVRTRQPPRFDRGPWTASIPHSALRTPHSALRTPHFAFRTPHSALRTPHSALRTRLPAPSPSCSIQDDSLGFKPHENSTDSGPSRRFSTPAAPTTPSSPIPTQSPQIQVNPIKSQPIHPPPPRSRPVQAAESWKQPKTKRNNPKQTTKPGLGPFASTLNPPPLLDPTAQFRLTVKSARRWYTKNVWSSCRYGLPGSQPTLCIRLLASNTCTCS